MALAKLKASQKATLSVLPGVSLGSVAQRVDISPVEFGGCPRGETSEGKKTYIGNLWKSKSMDIYIIKNENYI